MTQKTEDVLFMSRCLQLARLGESFVAPNPMVGAVLVYNNEIIGEGYHKEFGGLHAEPNAINSVINKSLIPLSTLYVNLEPCSHYGKTPPCADLIVKSGIKKVVVGTTDPNPKVAGKGIQLLKKAGIEVIVGVLENECNDLNKRFFTMQVANRPFIILKWAQTKDGFIDKARSKLSDTPLLISNSITNQLTHKMRAENQSILVGTNTVLLDNPRLTVRNWKGKNPIRIVLDSEKRIPSDFNVFDDEAETLIFTKKIQLIPKSNVKEINVNLSKNGIHNIIKAISKQGIHSVLVEGGAKLLTSFIESGCWDEANVEIAPVSIGKGRSAPKMNQLPSTQTEYGGHIVLHYENIHSKD